jgi:hypothetical protein
MSIHFQKKQEGVWVATVQGVLSPRVSTSIVAMLRQLGPATLAVIDVGQVCEFHDSAIGSIAQALRGQDCARVQLKGLPERQAKILRYFGIDPSFPTGSRLTTRDVAGPERYATVEHL